MLMIRKPTYRKFPVTVLKFRWCGTLRPVDCGANFKCSACGGRLGARRFGIAWIRDGEEERSLRLCEDCGREAETSIEKGTA